MSWDPFQRDVLAELGHVVYRQAGVDSAPGSDVAGIDAHPADIASLEERMLARVARAAGMTVAALQARFEDMKVIARLRGDAAAKRALWPRLRALRRQRR